MATLEVHDGRGRVEYVVISRDHTALFGSDPKCDVVVNDPQALPFHGRLRWKSGKFKAEAFPEAKALDLNGKKVVASTFNVGDELKVGSYKIFLQNAEDGVTDTDKTREQAAPSARQAAGKRAGQAAGAGTATLPGPAGTAATAKLTAPVILKPKGPIRKVLDVLMSKDQKPGEESLTSSPLVLGLVIAFAALIVLGIWLYNFNSKRMADNQYVVATESYTDKDWLNSIKNLETFLSSNPREVRAGKARVMLAMANVRQYTGAGSPNWTAALKTERDQYKKVGNEPTFADDTDNLAEEILKTAIGLTDRAKDAADAYRIDDATEMMNEANSAVTLHDKVSGDKALTLRGRSLFPQKLVAARASLEKAKRRQAALDTMDVALKASSADDFFSSRDKLVADYGDLSVDKDLVAKLKAATELVKKNVKFDPSGRPAETTPNPELLGPPTSLVLRTDPTAGPTEKGPNVYALAQGMAYALDGTNGAPKWHVPVGLSSPFPPIAIPGLVPSALVFDARHGELVKLDGRDGKLIWRQATGETIDSPPLIKGTQVYQVTPSGKILLLDLNTGAIKGTLNLGRPAAKAPTSDEKGEYLYLPADRDVVFVLQRDPLECLSVEYLGQGRGSIPCAPAQIGPYLIVPENKSLINGRWTVYQLEDEGKKLKWVQEVPIQGWTWTPPMSQAKVVWSITDRGALSAFTIGTPQSGKFLTLIDSTPPDALPNGPAYIRGRTETELWLSSARVGRFDLNEQLGKVSPSWTVEKAGTSMGPIQMAERLGVLTHQFLDRPGVAVWGVDFANKKVVWKSILGVPWPLEPIPIPGSEGMSCLSTDGKILTISKDQFSKGGFVQMPLEKPGYFYLPDNPLKRIDSNGLTLLVPAPDADHVFVRDTQGDEDFRRVDLPAPLGATPLFWGNDLFVPGLDGRVYLVDPRTGASRAEPYVPTFEKTKPAAWKAPVRLVDDAVILADESGRIRRLTRVNDPRPRLAVVGEVIDLKSSIVADPVSTQQAIIIVTTDGKIRSLTGTDLSPIGAWTLEAPRSLGPTAVAGYAVILDAAGGALVFGPDGQRMWTVDLRDPPPLGPPLLKDDAFWFLSRDGVLQRLGLQDGSKQDRIALDVLPTSGLNTDGPDVLVPSAPGTYRRLKAKDEKVGLR